LRCSCWCLLLPQMVIRSIPLSSSRWNILVVFLVLFPGSLEARRSIHHHQLSFYSTAATNQRSSKAASVILALRGGGDRQDTSINRFNRASTTLEVVDKNQEKNPSSSISTAAVVVGNRQAGVDRVEQAPHIGGATMTDETKNGGTSDALKLLIGAGGIYAAFLYYGNLQEDVFLFQTKDGVKFTQAWFLQVLEALANVIVGFVGMSLTGATKGIPFKMFAISGAAQVSAKSCTSLALANGLSFPVATLAKSGKMAPVMAGSLLLGGASYSVREYLQVVAIIGGTAIVSMGKKKGGESSYMGIFYICLSLLLDGVTAGFQKRLKTETAKAGVKPKPYDFMFWTNLFMCLTAAVVALGLGELV
jgi:solute carrier family 35 (UDP-galactose transporter), member B1